MDEEREMSQFLEYISLSFILHGFTLNWIHLCDTEQHTSQKYELRDHSLAT